jgi:hypothetical protein
MYTNDNLLIEEFREMAGEDFLICGECSYDMQFQQYHLAYFRSYSYDELPSKRYIRPDDSLIMNAVPGFDDRDTINKCLLCNYVVSYEPYFFKGMPSDYPLTMDYGMKMQALREETAEYTWYGHFCEKKHAKVYAGEQVHPHYSVFKSKESGNLAVVVANNTDVPITVSVKPDCGTITRYRAVDGDWCEGETMTIAPHTAVVALEK